MGGDNSPSAQVLGGLDALREFPDLTVLFVGDPDAIRSAAQAASLPDADGLNGTAPEYDYSAALTDERAVIIPSESVITMEDSALSVVREKDNSSMATALHLLKDGEGDAMVSSGNTGALHAGSSLVVRRIKGVRRSVIATVLPFERPMLLIDSGANTEVEPEHLHQFALMGAVYMERLHSCRPATVGLLNNGTEPTKGTKLLKEAYELLAGDAALSFVGNIEGKTVPLGSCDVLVTDGFTGNVLLKMTEGLSSFLFSKLRGCFEANIVTKLSAAAMRGQLRRLKRDFDASEYGGAPLLGLSKPVVKAHGSADARAIMNAVRQAAEMARQDVSYEISARIAGAE